MKRHKLWKTRVGWGGVGWGEGRLRCFSSAIQTRPGPSSLLTKWSKTPIVFVSSFVLSVTPQTGGNSQGIYIYGR